MSEKVDLVCIDCGTAVLRGVDSAYERYAFALRCEGCAQLAIEEFDARVDELFRVTEH